MIKFSWLNGDVILQSLINNAASGKLDKSGAVQLYQKLQQSTELRLKAVFGLAKYNMYFPSKRHGNSWENGQPTGWVDHYTAAPIARSSLLWFSNYPRNDSSTSSAHFVVDRDGFPFVIIPHNLVAYHARSANATHFGCEMVCAGKLKEQKKQLYYMDNIPLPLTLYNEVLEADGAIWHNYTMAQKTMNVILKRMLRQIYPQLQREKFVDHHAVDPQRKEDCGPLWPMDKLNDLAFNSATIPEEL